MLIVTSARNQRGWSATDHMLDDGPLLALVGRRFSSLAALMAAARKAAASYATVEYEMDGRRYRYDGSPQGIPGRYVRAITEIR